MAPSEYDESGDSGDESSSSSRDVDRPRVAQWEEEEEDLEDVSSSKPGPSSKSEESIRNIRNDLSSFSYAALLKARQTLARAETQPNDSDDSESGELAEEGSSRPETKIALHNGAAPQKRKNKHAPVELSAKVPVSRKKMVVDVKKNIHRDPRFSALSGELSLHKFQTQYSFLADLHENELSTLKENLKRAKKLLRSSPRDLLEAREEEVQRLEAAVKRAESSVNRDRQEQVTQTAMEKLRKEEQEKQKQGKSGWWLKDSAKKEVVLKARHDALVESGGKVAVKKAIEKRQQKINQKEKRSRPSFVPRTSNAESGAATRKRTHTAIESNQRKRRKFT